MKRLLLTIFLFSCIYDNYAYCHDFMVNGKCFNVVSLSERTCELVRNSNKTPYLGFITIPETVSFNNVTFKVVGIGDNAFANSKISGIKIPISIKTIGTSAFLRCTMLTAIQLPDSLIAIGDYCFSGCTKLTKMFIPNTVKAFGNYIFENCSSLLEVILPSNLEYLCGTFWNCSNLRKVRLPESLHDTGTRTFSGNNAVISMSLPGNITSIGELSFAENKRLKNITFPNALKTIGRYSFKDCITLENIKLPASLKDLRAGAFSGCISLKTIVFPDSLLFVGERAFSGCTSLSTIKINSSLRKLEEHLFEKCTSLVKVVIPESISIIDRFCFYGCSNLKCVNIPKNVTRLNQGTFMHCNLSKLFLHSGIEILEFNSIGRCDTLIIEDSKSTLDIEVGTDPWMIGYLYWGRNAHFDIVDKLVRSVKTLEIGFYVKDTDFMYYIDLEDIESIICNSAIPPIVKYDMGNKTYINATLRVPLDALDNYKNHPYWGKFLKIRPISGNN